MSFSGDKSKEYFFSKGGVLFCQQIWWECLRVFCALMGKLVVLKREFYGTKAELQIPHSCVGIECGKKRNCKFRLAGLCL
jgi:hypothetical protein